MTKSRARVRPLAPVRVPQAARGRGSAGFAVRARATVAVAVHERGGSLRFRARRP